MEEQFPVPRNNAASKIGNGVISLLWQLWCHCNPDHNKFSPLSNTTVVLISPNLCFWRHGLRSNLEGIDLEKLYRATFRVYLALIIWLKFRIFRSLDKVSVRILLDVLFCIFRFSKASLVYGHIFIPKILKLSRHLSWRWDVRKVAMEFCNSV